MKKSEILPQIVSVMLVIFFSIILVNTVDFEIIREKLNSTVTAEGNFGVLLYIVGNSLLYMLLIPSTVLGAGSGVIFGFPAGLLIYSLSCLLSSVAVYFSVRFFFRHKIQQIIFKRKKLVNFQSFIEKEGIRFLFFIRFLPVHATLINSLFAVSIVKSSKFLISCLFLIPEWILHVYLGYVASVTTQNARQDGLAIEDYLRIFSLAISIIAIVYLGWIAQRVIRQSQHPVNKETIAIINKVE